MWSGSGAVVDIEFWLVSKTGACDVGIAFGSGHAGGRHLRPFRASSGARAWPHGLVLGLLEGLKLGASVPFEGGEPARWHRHRHLRAILRNIPAAVFGAAFVWRPPKDGAGRGRRDADIFAFVRRAAADGRGGRGRRGNGRVPRRAHGRHDGALGSRLEHHVGGAPDREHLPEGRRVGRARSHRGSSHQCELRWGTRLGERGRRCYRARRSVCSIRGQGLPYFRGGHGDGVAQGAAVETLEGGLAERFAGGCGGTH
mmetsp:Transcript_56381/g.157104  ORF Transcript_56381/g.157104 Transcript_56381/m.157104 type:complete len:256 (+) Transcript_56381:157-924(+)